MSTPFSKLEHGSDNFWAEISPCDHLVQIYEEDAAFLDTLEGFISGGIRADDGVIIIATPIHRKALEERLTKAHGAALESARAQDRYIALDAEETLSKFMRNGWPDEALFRLLVPGLLARAGGGCGRRVRAFGEMVAVLWARGFNGATVQLERLWHELCQEQGFSLFCAYPRTGFTRDATASMQEICATHSRVIASHP